LRVARGKNMDRKMKYEEHKQQILDDVKNIMEIATKSQGFLITIKYNAGEIPFIDYTIKNAMSVPKIDGEKKG
jgi:hypothetical protein